MPILCLEGPSAAGKSSTARYLAEHHSAIHIPEANLLFQRPENASPYWYYERQIECLQIARSYPREKLVILDGDPFQPVWYNFLFPAISNLSNETVLNFYRSKLEGRDLAWPERYVALTAPPEELRKRKHGDLKQQRRKFEAHLVLVEFLPLYFARLNAAAPGLAVQHEAETIEGNAQVVLEASSSLEVLPDGLQVFDEIANWILNRSSPGLATS
jgi:hypothetical protein